MSLVPEMMHKDEIQNHFQSAMEQIEWYRKAIQTEMKYLSHCNILYGKVMQGDLEGVEYRLLNGETDTSSLIKDADAAYAVLAEEIDDLVSTHLSSDDEETREYVLTKLSEQYRFHLPEKDKS